jgi:hypothetical protein
VSVWYVEDGPGPQLLRSCMGELTATQRRQLDDDEVELVGAVMEAKATLTGASSRSAPHA